MEISKQKTSRAFIPTSEPKYAGLLYAAREFLNSVLFYAIQAALAVLIVLLRMEVIGAIIFVGLLAVIVMVCDDISATTLPFLLLCTFTTNCYDSFDTFMQYAIYAPIVVLAFVYHFMMYGKGKKLRFGESMHGISAVSIAVFMGGIGTFTLKEYIAGSYYIFGLGMGMVAAYLVMKSLFYPRRNYDYKKKFAWLMTFEGLTALAMIVIGTLRAKYKLLGGNKLVGYYLGFSPNNLSTMLMFAMPFPLFLAKKKWTPLALLTPFFYLAILLTDSRGGFLFGALELVVCCLFWIFDSETNKVKWIKFACCAVLGVAMLIAFWDIVKDIIQGGFAQEGAIKGSIRDRMIWEAVDNFFKNPFVGTGILDDSISYGDMNKAGTMTWYHMMIPQIVGSMGLIGVVAYAYQFIGRTKLVFTKKCRWSLVLGVSYLGVFLMSQVNPGEFCPLPFELLAVLLFILQEKRLEEEQLPLRYDLKSGEPLPFQKKIKNKK